MPDMNDKRPSTDFWLASDDLPRLETIADLRSWSGVSTTEIRWLCKRKNPNVSHYCRRIFRKRNGQLRLIESPKFKLKRLQRDLLNGIVAAIPTHPASHGFCAARSVLTFIESHIGKTRVLKLDLQDFFPGIRAGRVFGLFRTMGYLPAVASLLTDLCVSSVPRDELLPLTRHAPHDTRHQIEALYAQRHLPQGAPTSPALANLCAFKLDARLSGLAHKLQISYSRYADDLVFSADSPILSRNLAKRIVSIIREEGFVVNDRKTKWMFSGQRQRITGIVINNKPNIDRRSIDRLKAILHNCCRYGPGTQNRENKRDFRAYLLGKIAWVKQVNSARGEKLMKVFQEIDWSGNQHTT